MAPYLIFSDIDGTLVNDQQQVSPQTSHYIKRLLDQGHQFYLATGRMYASAQLLAQQLDPRVKIIASNGSVYNLQTQLIQQTLSITALSQLYTVLTEQDLAGFFFTDHQVIYTRQLPDYFKASDKNRIASNNPADYQAVHSEAELLTFSGQIVNRIIIEDDISSRLITAKNALQSSTEFDLSSSNPNNLEIIPHGVSKATAIRSIMQTLGVMPKHTIAFGDGINDLPMLRTVGYGVAMENAQPIVKAQASFSTTDNLHQGVVTYLQNFFEES